MTGEGIPHPRAADDLIGHETAENALLDAYRSGRLAHAWLITGPRGIGKATLAYRFARFILASASGKAGGLFGAPEPPEARSLAVSRDSAVFSRVASSGHPDLATVERAYDEKAKRLRSEIVVDDVRRLHHFFSMTGSESDWRIAIVDAADEMNQNAANALLKLLEEPPAHGLLLLISHAPGRLLPTIRSRCRHLALRSLAEETVAEVIARRDPAIAEGERLVLARLARGSPGRALDLASQGGVDLYREMAALLAGLPRLDIQRLYGFADRLSGKDGDAAFRAFVTLAEEWFQRIVRIGARAEDAAWRHDVIEGEGAALARLAALRPPMRWLEVKEEVTELLGRGDALNLDRRQLVVSAFSKLRTFCEGRA